MEYPQTGASRYVCCHRHWWLTRQDGYLDQLRADSHVCMTARKPDLFDTPVITRIGLSAVYILGKELDTSLVQGQGMSKIANMFTESRRARQRPAPTEANRRHSVPGKVELKYVSRQDGICEKTHHTPTKCI